MEIEKEKAQSVILDEI